MPCKSPSIPLPTQAQGWTASAALLRLSKSSGGPQGLLTKERLPQLARWPAQAGLVGLSFVSKTRYWKASAFHGAPAACSPVPNPLPGPWLPQSLGHSLKKAPGCPRAQSLQRSRYSPGRKVLRCSGPKLGNKKTPTLVKKREKKREERKPRTQSTLPLCSSSPNAETWSGGLVKPLPTLLPPSTQQSRDRGMAGTKGLLQLSTALSCGHWPGGDAAVSWH